jgi:hypothetical protein
MAGHNRGRGRGIAFILAHVNHTGDECLIWPMGCDRFGYPTFGLNGKVYKGHRYMCELAHGPAPTPEHHAAHTCGGGRQGCIHPQHLYWATAKENADDAARMGRCKPKGSPRHKLTEEQVAEIRALKGSISQYEIAKLFGMSAKTISHIHTGRLWPSGKLTLGGFAPGDPKNPFASNNRIKGRTVSAA